MDQAGYAQPPALAVPPRPPRIAEDKIMTKYKRLQMKWTDLWEDNATLKDELKKAEAKEQKLQDECNLILDQLMNTESGRALLSRSISAEPATVAQEPSSRAAAAFGLAYPGEQQKRPREHDGPEEHEVNKRMKLENLL